MSRGSRRGSSIIQVPVPSTEAVTRKAMKKIRNMKLREAEKNWKRLHPKMKKKPRSRYPVVDGSMMIGGRSLFEIYGQEVW
jgi:hypothetical protein